MSKNTDTNVQTYFIGHVVKDACVKAINEMIHYGGLEEKILFAGFFGSRVKGYNRVNSDYDVYIVYLRDIKHYCKALNVEFPTTLCLKRLQDTQCYDNAGNRYYADTDNVPGGGFKVQYNFIEYTDFVKGLTTTNVDFRYALHTVFFNPEHQTLPLLQDLARSFLDRTKIRASSFNRASNYISSQSPESKAIKPNLSESLDALHYFLLGVHLGRSNGMSEVLESPLLKYSFLIEEYTAREDNYIALTRLFYTLNNGSPITYGDIDVPAAIKLIMNTLVSLQEKYPMDSKVEPMYEVDDLYRTVEKRMVISQRVNIAFLKLLVIN